MTFALISPALVSSALQLSIIKIPLSRKFSPPDYIFSLPVLELTFCFPWWNSFTSKTNPQSFYS